MLKDQILAYIVGLTVGDGHVEKNAQRFVIYSNRDDFIGEVRKILDEIGCKTSKFFDKAAAEFKLASTSARFYKLLLDCGIKAGNKTTAKMKINIPKQNITYFIGGLFDAEGWCEIDKGKYKRIRLKMNNNQL